MSKLVSYYPPHPQIALLSMNGSAAQECCESRSNDSTKSRHIEALSKIVMELMQGYSKEDEAIGIEDLDRWPSDSNAVSFLSTTVTAASLAELTEVCQITISITSLMISSIRYYNSLGARKCFRV